MTQYESSKQIVELLKVKGELERLKGNLSVQAVLKRMKLLVADLTKLGALRT